MAQLRAGLTPAQSMCIVAPMRKRESSPRVAAPRNVRLHVLLTRAEHDHLLSRARAADQSITEVVREIIRASMPK
jgi:hypothetical protein